MGSVETRGSQKLIADLIQKGSAATPEEVKAAFAIPATDEYQLLRYFPRGIPPVYYELEATFQVPQPSLPDAITSLAAHEAISNINVLIRGIPPVVKTAEITAVLANSLQGS